MAPGTVVGRRKSVTKCPSLLFPRFLWRSSYPLASRGVSLHPCSHHSIVHAERHDTARDGGIIRKCTSAEKGMKHLYCTLSRSLRNCSATLPANDFSHGIALRLCIQIRSSLLFDFSVDVATIYVPYSDWAEGYPDCSGSSQSPINLSAAVTKKFVKVS